MSITDKEAFMLERCADYNDSSLLSRRNFFKSLSKWEEHFGKDIYYFTLEEVIQLFNAEKWTKKNTFYGHVTVLRSYCDWYANKYKIKDFFVPGFYQLTHDDVNSSDIIQSHYFKDFEDFKQAIEAVYDNENTGAIDECRYLMDKMFYLLHWYGFTQEDITNMRIYDVDLTKKAIKSPVTGKIAILDDYTFEIVNRCRHLEGYLIQNPKSTWKTIRRVYRETNMLLKSTNKSKTSGDEPVAESFIKLITNTQRMFAFNLPTDHPYYGKRLSEVGIIESSAFCRFLEYEQENEHLLEYGDYEIVCQLLEKPVSKTTCANALATYRAWKRFFYRQ